MNGQFKMEITKNQQVTFKTGYSVEAGQGGIITRLRKVMKL